MIILQLLYFVDVSLVIMYHMSMLLWRAHLYSPNMPHRNIHSTIDTQKLEKNIAHKQKIYKKITPSIITNNTNSYLVSEKEASKVVNLTTELGKGSITPIKMHHLSLL